MYNIAIIGAGQLGSRHLQSLAHLTLPVEIFVIDPSMPSLEVAQQRWRDVNSNPSFRIHFFESIASLPFSVDVAIVATNANIRRKVVEQILQHCSVKFLVLEKVLFQSIEEYDVMRDLMLSKNVTAYVNCPRRMYSYYKNLRDELKNYNTPLQFNIQGNSWGMGCNIIHFIDLFFFLRDDKITKTSSLLDEIIHEAKRPGYIEFTGQYILENEYGDSFLAICRDSNIMVPTVITISSSDFTYRIVEAERKAVMIHNSGELITSEVVPLYQSQLTEIVVEQLLSTGLCELTPYEESSYLHQIFLEDFLSHYNSITDNPNNKICPIT